MEKQPPKYPLSFLRWFCREDYLEEIEGDLIEVFEKQVEFSPGKAKRQFAWNVFRSFRLKNIKTDVPGLNAINMFSNYIKIALRIFRREKSFTLINVLGLATGFAITLLIIQYARFELSYENMHENADRIVRLTIDYLDGETTVTQDCETYLPIGPRIKADLPEVEAFARVYDIEESTVIIGEKSFLVERPYAADSSFFSMFSYPLLYGSKAHIFNQPYQMVLTESTALKYFNRVDVLDELVKMPLNDKTVSFKVVGVVPDSPPNTHLKFDMLISFATMKTDFDESDDNWDTNNSYTYVLLAPHTEYEVFSQNLADFSKQLTKEGNFENERLIGQKISDIHLYSKKTFEPETNGDANSVFFLLGVAFLVIISAFVNYINLATSKALDRAKEVGIRKVVGSTKNQLIAQFLTESLLINVFAGICALWMIYVTREQFILLAGLPENFAIFSDMAFWQILAVFMVTGVFLSGAYPAFVLSSFKPVSVLKGQFSHSTRGILLRKGLVIFQFAVTIILLIQTFTVYEQLKFMRKKELGMKIDHTVVVRAPAQDTIRQNYSAFKQELLTQAHVQSVSLSTTVPGLPSSEMSTTTGINLSEIIEDHNYNFYLYWIDADYIPQMEIELVAGKNFESGIGNNQGVIVNEEAVRLWGLTDSEQAVGKTLRFWGRTWEIRGVLKNYHHESAKAAYIPIIHLYSGAFSSFASIRFSGGDPAEQVAQIEKIFKADFPYTPFTYFFLDSQYDKQFKADERFQDVFSVLTVFAILIACLGLFGMASFVISKRTKEIGIRKVLGASIRHILILLSRDFMKTVLISMLIGIPITYFLVRSWLENFAFRMEISWWLFAFPAIVVFLLVILSLSVRTIKTALANPVDSLRDE
ncbi:MAG: ABC transporter permease [Bacteroidia bacterium]